MSSPNTAVYSRIVFYNDHDDAVLTASSTATGFPASDTQNNIRSRVFRTTGTGTQSMTGVLSASRVANHFSMWRLRGRSSVQLQLFSDAGASAQVYSSGSNAINTVITDSDPFSWSTGSNNPFLQNQPYWLWFNNTTYRSYKITWSGSPSDYSYYQVSRIWLGKALELTQPPNFGIQLGMDDLTDRNRSMGGSLRTNIGESWKKLQFDLGKANADHTTWLKIMEHCGTGRDLVVSIWPELGNEDERDYMINGKFVALDPLVRDVAVYTKRVQIEGC